MRLEFVDVDDDQIRFEILLTDQQSSIVGEEILYRIRSKPLSLEVPRMLF